VLTGLAAASVWVWGCAQVSDRDACFFRSLLETPSKMALSAREEDIQKMLAAKVHVGTNNSGAWPQACQVSSLRCLY
jgi:hypothetical protein